MEVKPGDLYNLEERLNKEIDHRMKVMSDWCKSFDDILFDLQARVAEIEYRVPVRRLKDK